MEGEGGVRERDKRMCGAIWHVDDNNPTVVAEQSASDRCKEGTDESRDNAGMLPSRNKAPEPSDRF